MGSDSAPGLKWNYGFILDFQGVTYTYSTAWTITVTYKKGIPSVQTKATCPTPVTWDGKSDVKFNFTAGSTSISNMNPGVSVTGWQISGFSDDGKLTSPTTGNSTAAYTWSFTVPGSSIVGNSKTFNMNALAVATLSDGTTARGQVSCPVTIASNPPAPTPSPTPTPANPPPTAVIVAPDTTKQGQDTFVSASGSHDYQNGTNLTYQWYWYETYSDGSNGPVHVGGTSINDTMNFPNQGKVWVVVGVKDQWGGSAQASKQITVTPPTPTAVLTVNGNKKEYRDLVLDGSGSSTPTSYPITSRQFSITPMFGASAANIVTSGSLTGSTNIHAMFKVTGTYKVSYTVTNSLGYSDTASVVVDIAQDLAPVAVVNAPTILYRDPAMGYAATLNLKDLSYSLDADMLGNLYGTITYDANNNNTYSQTVTTFNVDVNTRSKSLSFGQVGKYQIQYYAKETFNPGVFSAQVPPSAYKVSPVLVYHFTVDNLPPYTSLTGGKSYKVDLAIDVGNLSPSEISYWQNNYFSYIRNNLLAKNIDANLFFRTWDTFNIPNYQSDANNFLTGTSFRSNSDGKYFIGATNTIGSANGAFGKPTPPIPLKLIPVIGSGLNSPVGSFSGAAVNNSGDVYAWYQQNDYSYNVYNNNNWGSAYSFHKTTPTPASGYSSSFNLQIDDTGKPWSFLFVPTDAYYGTSYVMYNGNQSYVASDSNFPSWTSTMSNINGTPTLWTATVQVGYGFAQERAFYWRSSANSFNPTPYQTYQAINVTDQYVKGFYLQGHEIWVGEHHSNFWPQSGQTDTVTLIYKIDNIMGSNYNYKGASYPWACGNNLCFFTTGQYDGKQHKVTMNPANGAIVSDVVTNLNLGYAIRKIDSATQTGYQIANGTVTKIDLAHATVIWQKTFTVNILDISLQGGVEYYLFTDPYHGNQLFLAREGDTRNPPSSMQQAVYSNGFNNHSYFNGSGTYAYVNGDGKFVKVSSDGTTKVSMLPQQVLESGNYTSQYYWTFFLDAADSGVFVGTNTNGHGAYWLESENFATAHDLGIVSQTYQSYADPNTGQPYFGAVQYSTWVYYRWDSASSTAVSIASLPAGLIMENGNNGNAGQVPIRPGYSFSGNLTNDPIFAPSKNVNPSGYPYVYSRSGLSYCENSLASSYYGTGTLGSYPYMFDYSTNTCTPITTAAINGQQNVVSIAARYAPSVDDLLAWTSPAVTSPSSSYVLYRVNAKNQWTPLKSFPYSSYGNGSYPFLVAQDESGNAYVLYYKNPSGAVATLETNIGGTWNTYTVNVGYSYYAISGIRASNGALALFAGSAGILMFDSSNGFSSMIKKLPPYTGTLKGPSFYYDKLSQNAFFVTFAYDSSTNSNYSYLNSTVSGWRPVKNVDYFKAFNGKVVYDDSTTINNRTIQSLVDPATGIKLGKGGIAGMKSCSPYNAGYMACINYNTNTDELFAVIDLDTNLPSFANTLVQNGVKTIFTGTGIQADVQPFTNATNGTFFDYTTGQVAMDSIISYIDTNVKSASAAKPNYFLVGDTIAYSPSYTDAEGDPKQAERWKYVHDPSVFDNSNGTLAQNNQYVSSPITSFPQVGKYTVTYAAEDTVSNAAFSKWSPDSAPFVFYVNRKPIASFSATLHPSSNPSYVSVTMKDSSYDLDHSVSDTVNKGIASRTFQWKDVDSGTWTQGQPSQLLVNHTYRITEVVTDIDGAISDPYTLDVMTSPGSVTPDNPPSANITVPASTDAAAPTLFNTLRPTIQWAYSDPDGDTQAIYHLDIYDYSNNLVFSSGDVASNATSYLTGINLTDKTNYYATVKVSDGTLWSTVSAPKYFRIQLNSPPSAALTYPTGSAASPTIVSTPTPTIQWTQTDPDAGTVFQAFQVIIQNASGTTVLDSGSAAQWTSSTSAAWKVTSALPSGQNLQVYVRVYDGMDWSSWSPVGWMYINRPPTGNISFTLPIYQHDTPTFTVTQSDPDGDPVSITVDASYNGGAYTTIQSWPGVASGTSKAFTYGPLNQGSYTLRLTLNDGKGGTFTQTYPFTAQALNLAGYVSHTADWESYRQTWNTNHPTQQRASNVFWAGESFMLSAVVTNTGTSTTKPTSLTATLVQTGDGVALSSSDNVNFAAEMLNTNFVHTLSDGNYTMRFTLNWSNGLTETVDIPVVISGNIYDIIVDQQRE